MKKGFSLIELLLVLSIIGVLSTYSVYGIRQLVHQRELDNAIGHLYSTLHSAQANSEASGFTTIVCPSWQLNDCEDDSDWSLGWIAYSDLNENHFLDVPEPVIDVKKLVSSNLRISFNAPSNAKNLIFYRNGRLWPNGNITICHDRIGKGLKIIFILSGRIRQESIAKAQC